MTSAIAALPFRFFDLRVLRSTRLSPSFLRITFGGADLAEVNCGGRDQRVKLFFPHQHQDVPVLPENRDGDWFTRWRAMDPAVRAVMRTYTVREHRKDVGELDIDIDFAVHGPGGGPATRWAARASEGSRVALLGPVVEDNGGVDFQPPRDADWVLLTADETALPAVEAILSWLPADTRARVWVEVACAEDIRGLWTEADAEITWLVRDAHESRRDAHGADESPVGSGGSDDRSGGGVGGSESGGGDAGAVLEAVRGACLPEGKPYAWIAGESAEVQALRRHLVRERGFGRDSIVFTGYWRRGAGEDDLLVERFGDGAVDQE
jgi:NADPH-dependent ferric siderophore reductase